MGQLGMVARLTSHGLGRHDLPAMDATNPPPPPTARRKDDHIEIVLGDHETKNAEAHTYPLKGDTRQMYETYLRVHRPQLVRGEDHGWLWPGAGDGHKSASTLRQQLRKMIAKATGLRMTPHQFRHLAARLMLEAKPGSYELARRVLGHKNLKTTVKFYAGLDSRQAVETYDSIIDERRDGKPVK